MCLRYVLLASALAFFILAGPLSAQEPVPWPRDVSFERGDGFYLSLFKLAPVWGLFLIWVGSANWVNQDCLRLNLDCDKWNSIMVFPFVVAFMLVWVFPIFLFSYMLMWITLAVPLVCYVSMRNQRVSYNQRVLTPSHLGAWLRRKISRRPVARPPKSKAMEEAEGPPVELVAMGCETDAQNQRNLEAVKASSGYLPIRQLMHDALAKRSTAIVMDFKQAVKVRYQVDGAWHTQLELDRETADLLLAVFKTLAALDPTVRHWRQKGEFAVRFEDVEYLCRLTSQAAKSGERVLIQLDDGAHGFTRFEELGMRPKMRDQLKELLAREQGILLITAPPRAGFDSTFNVALHESDRFLRSFVAIEDVNKLEDAIENVPLTTFDSTKLETPLTVLPKLLREYPEVLVLRDLFDGPTVDLLCDQPQQDRLVIGGLLALDAAEALLRVLALKPSPVKFAAAITAVLNQRVLRTLCRDCKEAYIPPPKLLKQLNIPEGRVRQFYRPRQTPLLDEDGEPQICKTCQGTGYFGQTGVFELLIVDDNLRRVIVETPELVAFRTAARAAGMATIQEEGIVMAAKGATSLSELSRVLKDYCKENG